MVEEESNPVPKISIIVPVYNVEKYLRRCIDSILAQTFMDFELILVDDGSPDGCPTICDEYAVQDSRIRVIHQTNSGVSAARNAGLDVARGKWIGFVDSDDWIEPNMYEYLHAVAKKTNADAVVCGFFGQHHRRVRRMCGTEKALKLIFEKNGFGGFSFLRLVAAEKVQDIRFDVNISYLEDMAFFYEVFKRCEKVYWDNKPLYHYEYNQSSVTSAYGLTRQAKSALTLLNRLSQIETNKKIRQAILYNRCHFLLSRLVQYIKKHDFDSAEYAYLYGEVKKNALPIVLNMRHNAKRKIVAFLIHFTPLLKPLYCEDKKRFPHTAQSTVTSQNLSKIAFVSPGYKPVPDVAGGAVEHLMTQIIEENEKNPRFYFELYTISDKALNAYSLKYAHINQIKDFRKTIFLRAFSFILNSLFTLFRCNARFNYFGREVVRRLPTDTAFILIENDVNIFKQIKQKMPKKPIVFHLHNDFDTLGEMQKSVRSMKYVADNASELWAVSTYLKKHLLSAYKNIPDSKIRVLENGIDRERFSAILNDAERAIAFRKKYGIPDSQFVILYAGRILRQKGVYELLQAVSILPKDMDCVLVVAGDIRSAPRMYRKQLKKILPKIKCRIIFTGYIPQYEIQNAYAVADIVAIPSQCQEAFCLVALEASCHCKTCVASISGGMAEVLDDSCAKMIALGDGYVERFRDAIYELYKDKGLRIKLAENAAKKSLQFPDPKQYFENFCTFAEKFISSGGNSLC